MLLLRQVDDCQLGRGRLCVSSFDHRPACTAFAVDLHFYGSVCIYADGGLKIDCILRLVEIQLQVLVLNDVSWTLVSRTHRYLIHDAYVC
jgi:hypothetical protein